MDIWTGISYLLGIVESFLIGQLWAAPETVAKKVATIDPEKYLKLKELYIQLKKERIALKKQNDEYIIQGLQMIQIVEKKDKEIDDLKSLIDKYETALNKRDADAGEMIKILDKYKERIIEVNEINRSFKAEIEHLTKENKQQLNTILKIKKQNKELLEMNNNLCAEIKKYRSD